MLLTLILLIVAVSTVRTVWLLLRRRYLQRQHATGQQLYKRTEAAPGNRRVSPLGLVTIGYLLFILAAVSVGHFFQLEAPPRSFYIVAGVVPLTLCLVGFVL